MKPSFRIPTPTPPPTPTPTPPPTPTPTPHSYRVGNGSEEWAIFKVFNDHFAHFSFSTSNLKSSYRVGSGYEEWANSMAGLPIK